MIRRLALLLALCLAGPALAQPYPMIKAGTPPANSTNDTNFVPTLGWVRSQMAPKASPIFTGTTTVNGQLVSQAAPYLTRTDEDGVVAPNGYASHANWLRVYGDNIALGTGAGGGSSQALMIDHQYGGATSRANHQSLFVLSRFMATDSSDPTWTNRNHVAGTFVAKAYAPAGIATSSTKAGAIFGLNPVAEAGPGAANMLDVTGVEADVGMATTAGASSAYRVGFRAASYGTGQASTLDSAFHVGVLSSGSIPWGYGVMFTSADSPAVSPVSEVLFGGAAFNGGTMSGVKGGINLSAFTFSSYAFASAGFLIDPVGALTAATARFNAATNGTLFIQPTSTSGELAIVAANNANTALKPLQVGGSKISLVGGATVLQTYTVATLPACTAANTDVVGGMVVVTDFNGTPTYRGALTGGGSTRVPAFCNGSAWEAH